MDQNLKIQLGNLEDKINVMKGMGLSDDEICKAFTASELDIIQKARHGMYADTGENRKLGRVGSEYGHAKREDPEKVARKEENKKSHEDYIKRNPEQVQHEPEVRAKTALAQHLPGKDVKDIKVSKQFEDGDLSITATVDGKKRIFLMGRNKRIVETDHHAKVSEKHALLYPEKYYTGFDGTSKKRSETDPKRRAVDAISSLKGIGSYGDVKVTREFEDGDLAVSATVGGEKKSFHLDIDGKLTEMTEKSLEDTLSKEQQVATILKSFKEGNLTDSEGNKVDSIEKAMEIAFEKGREGSRGGNIIGHTKSGKPVYEDKWAHEYSDFDKQDHEDAWKEHSNASSKIKNFYSKDQKKRIENHEKVNEHQRRAISHNTKMNNFGKKEDE